MVALTTQRIADEMRRQKALSNSIVNLQTSISTGIKVAKPSDDPQAWVEISDIARAQAQQSAWKTNISYAQYRAATAESTMAEMSNLLTRAQELMTGAGSVLSDNDRSAIAMELQTIKESIDSLLSSKDALGVRIFESSVALKIPVAQNLAVEVAPTSDSLTQGIDVNGTPSSLDTIFANAIASLATDDAAARGASLTALQAAGDHLTLALTPQGNRADRLDKLEESRVSTSINLTERRTALEEINLSEAIALLQSKTLSLEAAQATYAKLSQRTLFDLIV